MHEEDKKKLRPNQLAGVELHPLLTTDTLTRREAAGRWATEAHARSRKWREGGKGGDGQAVLPITGATQ